jgi:TPP-dependent 2-oxoacid decarboxylase
MQTVSVADYTVRRIADEGVAHCFGVAGDDLFPMCNAVESSQKVKWIGCALECLSKIARHTSPMAFGNFAGLSAAAACCSALINPENCAIEMERVIAEARRNNKPAYILVPSDHALAPVSAADMRPLRPKSNGAALKRAFAAISQRLRGAQRRLSLCLPSR